MSYRILVVEDNRMNMELFCDILGAAGHTVLQAFDAESGIMLANAESPDIILMDLALPGMDGLQATRILRRAASTRAIPVVALTAHAMQGDAARAIEAGCAGCMTKPIDTRKFVGAVVAYIESDMALDEAA